MTLCNTTIGIRYELVDIIVLINYLYKYIVSGLYSYYRWYIDVIQNVNETLCKNSSRQSRNTFYKKQTSKKNSVLDNMSTYWEFFSKE